MKTFRVVLLITGILVAGLAFNISFAQDAPTKEHEQATLQTHRSMLQQYPAPGMRVSEQRSGFTTMIEDSTL